MHLCHAEQCFYLNLYLLSVCLLFIQDYASIDTSLIGMFKHLPKHKNGKKIGLTWDALANDTFLKLKHAITDIVPL